MILAIKEEMNFEVHWDGACGPDKIQKFAPMGVDGFGKCFKTDRLVYKTSFCYTGCSSTKGGFSFDRKK